MAIPNEKLVLDEMRNFRYYRTSSGNQVMRAYGRGHDDIVMSLALAYSQYSGSDGFVFDYVADKEKDEEQGFVYSEDSFDELELANRAFR